MSRLKFAKLCELYPEVFAIDPAKRRPLAIGIHDELVKADTGLPISCVRQGLSSYCHSIGYLRGMRTGAGRHRRGAVRRSC
jgi:sRNA-binding protein